MDPKGRARVREGLFLLDHLAAFFADLVLVIFKARQQHARVLAFALAELGHIRPAGGALLRRALGKRESRYNGHGDNDEDKTQGHQRSLFCGAARKQPPIVSPTWRRDQRSSQVGMRFSIKAPIPSSASRASMFSTITSEV